MNTCQYITGIIIRHNCVRPAKGNCVECSRAVCNEHSLIVNGGILCANCSEKNDKASTPRGTRSMHESRYDDGHIDDYVAHSTDYSLWYFAAQNEFMPNCEGENFFSEEDFCAFDGELSGDDGSSDGEVDNFFDS